MMLAGDRLRKRQGPGEPTMVFIDLEISGHELRTYAKLPPLLFGQLPYSVDSRRSWRPSLLMQHRVYIRLSRSACRV